MTNRTKLDQLFHNPAIEARIVLIVGDDNVKEAYGWVCLQGDIPIRRRFSGEELNSEHLKINKSHRQFNPEELKALRETVTQRLLDRADVLLVTNRDRRVDVDILNMVVTFTMLKRPVKWFMPEYAYPQELVEALIASRTKNE